MASTIKRVVDNVRTGQMVFRDAARFRQIVSVLVRHGFGAFVERLNLQDVWLLGRIAEWRRQADERLPLERRVLLVIQELGPTFVKLGQILSTRPDVVPPALVAEFETLQDAVPPMDIEDVRMVVREDLGGELEDLFSSFDVEPLASASIAQVHRATTLEGEDAVVKVQRPGIRPQIEADVEILGFLARAAESNFDELRIVSPAGIVSEFEKAILRETDFRQELDNIERFRRNFADEPDVTFPLPYPALSTARVLTMQRVVGTKITEMTPDKFDVEGVVQTAIEAVAHMIFEDGFFHGDLHPGNALVGDDGTLHFIDLGLCGRLTRRQRDMVVDLMLALVREDLEGVARVFWKIGIHGPESSRDYESFQADVVEVLERWIAGKMMEEIEFAGFLRDVMEGAMRYRLRIPADYTMTFKAIITMEGVAKQLAPGVDIIGSIKPHVVKLATERYNPANLARLGFDAARDLSETLSALPEVTRGILEDLGAGRTRINLELTQLTELERSQRRSQGRLGAALLAASSALCGTYALDRGEWFFLGLPAVSFWFYLAAAFFALWFVAGGRR